MKSCKDLSLWNFACGFVIAMRVSVSERNEAIHTYCHS